MRTTTSFWMVVGCLGALPLVGCYGGEGPDSVENTLMEAEGVADPTDYVRAIDAVSPSRELHAVEDANLLGNEDVGVPTDMRSIATGWEARATDTNGAMTDDGDAGTPMRSVATAWEARATDTNGATTAGDAGAEAGD